MVQPHLYEFKRELPDSTHKQNPVFIAYGDNRPSWRADEGFLASSNWTRKRILLFPFFLPGLLFNGIYGGTAYIKHAPDLGQGMRKNVLEQIYKEVRKGDIDFIAHTGDIIENGSYFTQWEEFLTEANIELPVMKLVPYYPAPGNHERPHEKTYGKQNYDTVFPNLRFYTKKFKDAILIFLDSTTLLDQKGDIASFTVQDSFYAEYFVSDSVGAKPSWLEEQLTAAEEKYKIVVLHHPLLSHKAILAVISLIYTKNDYPVNIVY